MGSQLLSSERHIPIWLWATPLQLLKISFRVVNSAVEFLKFFVVVSDDRFDLGDFKLLQTLSALVLVNKDFEHLLRFDQLSS